jgi:hypothetical protein
MGVGRQGNRGRGKGGDKETRDGKERKEVNKQTWKYGNGEEGKDGDRKRRRHVNMETRGRGKDGNRETWRQGNRERGQDSILCYGMGKWKWVDKEIRTQRRGGKLVACATCWYGWDPEERGKSKDFV